MAKDYPPSYRNQTVRIHVKAVEIANGLLAEGAEEGVVISTSLKRVREFSKRSVLTNRVLNSNDPPTLYGMLYVRYYVRVWNIFYYLNF